MERRGECSKSLNSTTQQGFLLRIRQTGWLQGGTHALRTYSTLDDPVAEVLRTSGFPVNSKEVLSLLTVKTNRSSTCANDLQCSCKQKLQITNKKTKCYIRNNRSRSPSHDLWAIIYPQKRELHHRSPNLQRDHFRAAM